MQKKTTTKKLKRHSSRTAFALKVYAVVAKIPRGKVMTYREVATKAGNKKAARAVGTLMAKNFDLKIPCHRVIRSDGKIGNYNRGGSTAKLRILKREGAVFNARS